MLSALKHDLAGVPLRSQKVEVVKGMIFVNFTAQRIHSKLLMKMRSILYHDSSLLSVILGLSKNQRMHLPDGGRVSYEVIKKQNKIIKEKGLDINILASKSRSIDNNHLFNLFQKSNSKAIY